MGPRVELYACGERYSVRYFESVSQAVEFAQSFNYGFRFDREVRALVVF